MSNRIMIVDDAIFMRMKLKDILEKNGYEVVAEAQNGVDAISQQSLILHSKLTYIIILPFGPQKNLLSALFLK